MTKTDNNRTGATEHPRSEDGGEPRSPSAGLSAYFSGDEVTADLPSTEAAGDPLEMETPAGGLPDLRGKNSKSVTPIIFSPVAAARVPTPDPSPAAESGDQPQPPSVPRWVVPTMILLTLAFLALVVALLAG